MNNSLASQNKKEFVERLVKFSLVTYAVSLLFGVTGFILSDWGLLQSAIVTLLPVFTIIYFTATIEYLLGFRWSDNNDN